jgi:hypothetical protein
MFCSANLHGGSLQILPFSPSPRNSNAAAIYNGMTEGRLGLFLFETWHNKIESIEQLRKKRPNKSKWSREFIN